MIKNKVELELTTACNAACPSCRRTLMDDIKINHLTIDDIERYFDGVDVKIIKLCGVLGDPIANKDLYDIIEYFVIKGTKSIEISTNGGLKTKEFWGNLGRLSNISGGVVNVHFAIDGLITNDYRVGVDLTKVWNNVNAYMEAGGKAVWQFIIFDYNKHEIDDAKKLADKKGMHFRLRDNWRNYTSEIEVINIKRKAKFKDYD
jgi:MoaA/NifB/PqqE/SkfB family radical SAM enzyme